MACCRITRDPSSFYPRHARQRLPWPACWFLVHIFCFSNLWLFLCVHFRLKLKVVFSSVNRRTALRWPWVSETGIVPNCSSAGWFLRGWLVDFWELLKSITNWLLLKNEFGVLVPIWFVEACCFKRLSGCTLQRWLRSCCCVRKCCLRHFRSILSYHWLLY